MRSPVAQPSPSASEHAITKAIAASNDLMCLDMRCGHILYTFEDAKRASKLTTRSDRVAGCPVHVASR
jgi:hypothetical protein